MTCVRELTYWFPHIWKCRRCHIQPSHATDMRRVTSCHACIQGTSLVVCFHLVLQNSSSCVLTPLSHFPTQPQRNPYASYNLPEFFAYPNSDNLSFPPSSTRLLNMLLDHSEILALHDISQFWKDSLTYYSKTINGKSLPEEK